MKGAVPGMKHLRKRSIDKKECYFRAGIALLLILFWGISFMPCSEVVASVGRIGINEPGSWIESKENGFPIDVGIAVVLQILLLCFGRKVFSCVFGIMADLGIMGWVSLKRLVSDLSAIYIGSPSYAHKLLPLGVVELILGGVIVVMYVLLIRMIKKDQYIN